MTKNTAYDPFRTPLNKGLPPGEGLTERQAALAAAVRGSRALGDFTVQPQRRINTVTLYSVSRNDTPESARRSIDMSIAAVEGAIADVRRHVAAYGAGSLVPSPHAVSWPANSPMAKATTQREAILALYEYLHSTGHELVRAGDTPVIRAPDGGYVLAPKQEAA